MWLDIRYGVVNLIRWAPIVWFDADFDWEFLATIMEYKLRRMSAGFDKSDVTVNSKRHAQQMRICAELLKRLREDDYPFRDPREHDKAWAEHWSYMSNQDKRYLGLMLGKYLNHWWE